MLLLLLSVRLCRRASPLPLLCPEPRRRARTDDMVLLSRSLLSEPEDESSAGACARNSRPKRADNGEPLGPRATPPGPRPGPGPTAEAVADAGMGEGGRAEAKGLATGAAGLISIGYTLLGVFLAAADAAAAAATTEPCENDARGDEERIRLAAVGRFTFCCSLQTSEAHSA